MREQAFETPPVCTHTWPHFLSCTLAASTTTHARLYIHQYICTYTFATRMTTLRTLRPGASRLSGTSLHAKMWLVGPSSEGQTFFREIRWPIRWVPAVRW